MAAASELKPLRLLLVEDNLKDADLLLLALRREGYHPHSQRVDTEDEFRAHLSHEVQLILCDMALPQFDGLRALEILSESKLSIPLIIVSGAVSDEEAMEAYRHGASDYLLKDRLARLGAAVRQALQNRDHGERFRTYVENAPLGVIQTDPQGLIWVVNPAAQRLFEQDLGGRSLESLIGPLQAGIKPDQQIGGHWLDLHLVRLDDGSWLTYLRDVADRRRSDLLFREMAENLGDVVWLTNLAQSETVYVSPNYEGLSGRSCQEVYADPRAWLNAVHPDDRESLRQYRAGLQSGRSWEGCYRILAADGTIRWVCERSFQLRDDQGRPYRQAGLVRDVSERRELEQRLRQTQKMDAIATLAGGIAHDFNNLLTIISGHAAMLEPGSPDLAEHRLQIEEAARRSADLTRQLLVFSRRQPLRNSNLCLNELLEKLAPRLHELLGDQAELRLQLGGELPRMQGDAGMLEQLVLNLCTNARDAMPEGGRLTIQTARTSDGGLTLSVADTGVGISADDLYHIFEPFYTTKEVGRGTGMGLATVYGIVHTHQGQIAVDSCPGTGTTFLVRFSASPPPAPRPQTSALGLPAGTETILLVEDEKDVLKLATRILERCGYTVIGAGCADEALARWAEHGENVSMLLSDIVMPGELDGVALAQRLQTERADLRVLLSSGYPDRGRSGVALGEVRFLPKPYTPAQLAQAVRDCLDTAP